MARSGWRPSPPARRRPAEEGRHRHRLQQRRDGRLVAPVPGGQLQGRGAPSTRRSRSTYITNADEKPEKQLADIDDLLVKGVDALIVYPTVADAIIPAIEKVYAAGHPGRRVRRQHRHRQADLARSQQDLVRVRPRPGQVAGRGAEGQGQDRDDVGHRRQHHGRGPAGRAPARCSRSTPTSRSWTTSTATGRPPKAKSIMEAMIQAFPKIDGIWADSGLMSWPALQALKEAKRPAGPLHRRPAERLHQVPGGQQGPRLRLPHDHQALRRGGQAGR